MMYQDTGLPPNDMIEKAFKYSVKAVGIGIDRSIELYKGDIKAQFEQERKMVDRAVNAKKISADEAKRHKAELDQNESMTYAQLPMQAEMQKQMTVASMVDRAHMLLESGTASFDTVAASFIMDAVMSFKDYEDARGNFGEQIVTIVAEYNHFQIYRGEQKDLAQSLSVEAQDLIAVKTLSDVKQMLDMTMSLPPGMVPTMFPSNDVIAMGWAQTMDMTSPSNPKLKETFVSMFNEVAPKLMVGLKVELDKAGRILVTAVKVDAPGGLMFPGHPGNIGEDPAAPRPPTPDVVDKDKTKPKPPGSGGGKKVF